MRTYIFILLGFLAYFYGDAQDTLITGYKEWKDLDSELTTGFDISTYKTPDIKRRGLDLWTYFSHSSTNTNYKISNLDDKNTESSAELNTRFFYYTNTRKIISSLSAELYFSNKHYTTKKQPTPPSSITTSKSNYFNNNSYIVWDNKWYFTKKWFLSYGVSGQILFEQLDFENSNETQTKKSKLKDFNPSISPNIGVGYGRIELVHDARQAIYITNALSKLNVLTRALTDEEMYELAQIISSVKNARYLDTRLRRIHEISTMDAFFKSKNLISDFGPLYYTTLNDMWLYGDRFIRESGQEISFTFSTLHWSKRIKNESNHPILTDYGDAYSFELNYRLEQPFKQNWQHSFEANLSARISSSFFHHPSDIPSIGYWEESTDYNLYALYRLSYFPNTRTSISVWASPSLNLKDYHQPTPSLFVFNPKVGGQLNHYFSPNLQISANADIQYLDYDFKLTDRDFFIYNTFTTTFDIRLRYAFF